MAVSLCFYLLLILAFLTLGILMRHQRAWTVAILSASFIVGLLAWLVWNRPYFLTYVFPHANAVFFSNLFPFAVAMAAPAAVWLGKSKAERVRISGLMVGLLLASLTGTLPLFGEPAQTRTTEYFPDGTCRQTSINTCSAAASVTLLKQYGISATEGEMALNALSKQGRGTHPLGIYRALTLRVSLKRLANAYYYSDASGFV